MEKKGEKYAENYEKQRILQRAKRFFTKKCYP